MGEVDSHCAELLALMHAFS